MHADGRGDVRSRGPNPIAVGVRGVNNGLEFLFREIVGRLRLGLHPLHEDCRVLVDPIHSRTEPEKCNQPLMLATRGLRSIAPLAAKPG